MRHLTLFTLVLLLGIPVRAEEKEIPKEEAVKCLNALETALKDWATEAKLDITWKNDGQFLTGKYNTREFMIHGGTKHGAWTQEAAKEEGPDFNGLTLRFYVVRSTKLGRQSALPTGHSGPYWDGYFDELPIRDNICLAISLEYGSRIDGRKLTEIKRIAAEVAKAK